MRLQLVFTGRVTYYFKSALTVSFIYKKQYNINIVKKASCILISSPSEASVYTLVVCHIWRALGPDTTAPLCSDVCKTSSGSSHTKEPKLNRLWVHNTNLHVQRKSKRRFVDSPSAQHWCTASAPRRCVRGSARRQTSLLWLLSPGRRRPALLGNNPCVPTQHLWHRGEKNDGFMHVIQDWRCISKCVLWELNQKPFHCYTELE